MKTEWQTAYDSGFTMGKQSVLITARVGSLTVSSIACPNCGALPNEVCDTIENEQFFHSERVNKAFNER